MASHFQLFGAVLARVFFPQFSIVDSKTVQRSVRFFFPGFSNLDSKKRCKGVHCVDLDESFPTSIYLQNLASIQPRTSPKKFGKTGKRDFEISFALTPVRAFEIEGQPDHPPPVDLKALRTNSLFSQVVGACQLDTS